MIAANMDAKTRLAIFLDANKFHQKLYGICTFIVCVLWSMIFLSDFKRLEII
jgi:hypothetical protein